MFNEVNFFIRKIFNKQEGIIPLHEPKFIGKEKDYLLDCVDSTFVSSVGKYVDKFEKLICNITGAKYAIAAVNGTAALHISLLLAGVKKGDLVITQPLTFVATCNAIKYIGAEPLFIDIDKRTLGLSAEKLEEFLYNNVECLSDGHAYLKNNQKRIISCVPIHIFGHPVEIDKIVSICQKYNISVVEDAAEALGSTYKEKYTGTFGLLGTYSLNGNKIITCGGGGVIVTNNEQLAKKAKHITTTAKISHPWEYIHDEIGYNYRLTNINSALACAQIEQLQVFIENKRELAELYKDFFNDTPYHFFSEPLYSKSNYWLNALILSNRKERDEFLKNTNYHGIMTRPCWQLMNRLTMFNKCLCENIDNAEWLENRIVNIPSSVRL